MKLFLPFTILILSLISYSVKSQTIVSTSVENKNAILEEFTGIHCGFCPDGHAIAQSIKNAHPDDVFLINIHTGGYANPAAGEPDFRTAFGSSIAYQSGLAGYPAGTVNRHYFPGTSQGTEGSTAQSRNYWSTTANQAISEESYVNVAVEAEIDVVTRIMTVHVEAYYTANSPQGTNSLNVALLQDNTLGPQSGGGAGDNYNHMHRLVHMLTGQWGETLSSTTAGTFVDETFEYTLPNDYHGIDVNFPDMKIVAFITETHQEIASGSGCQFTYTNVTGNDVGINNMLVVPDDCSGHILPQFELVNNSSEVLNSLEIEYSVNDGDVSSYSWSGTLPTFQTVTVNLPEILYDVLDENTLHINLPDDDDMENNMGSTSFSAAYQIPNDYLRVHIVTDTQGYQCTWNILDAEGVVVESGGPYANNTTIDEFLSMEEGCYTFQIFDTGSNGGGLVILVDSNSQMVYYSSGDYGAGEAIDFSSPGNISVQEQAFSDVRIYPNPAQSQLNIENAAGLTLNLFDVLGRLIYKKHNIGMNEQIDLTHIEEGSYMLKLSNANETRNDKIVIVK